MDSIDRKFPAVSEERAKSGYIQPTETGLKDVYRRVANGIGTNVEHANRLYDYSGAKHWLSWSSPITSNAGTSRSNSLISCYLQTVGDSIDEITSKIKEYGMLSVRGGGVAAEFSSIRSVGSPTSKGVASPGLIPFLKVFDSAALGFRQGNRRGAFASYLSVSHPKILEFLNIRKAGKGDINRKCMNSHHAVIVPDRFMQLLVDVYDGTLPQNTQWDLIDPNTAKVVKRVKLIDLWKDILQARGTTGEPYVLFIDRVQEFNPLAVSHPVKTSNLCSEITLHTSDEETAVCCLASVNMLYWDEFKDDDQFWDDAVEALDNVLDIHAEHNQELTTIIKAITAARDIGIGMLGLHSYFQSKHIPFDSPLARSTHVEIAQKFQEQCVRASERLAEKRGIPERCELAGLMRRNLHVSAIAPNATTAIIMANVSPGIEPRRSNVYDQQTSAGLVPQRNPALKYFLKSKGLTPEARADIYHEIKMNGGSVQGVESLNDIMNDYDRDVFKSAEEMSQYRLAEFNGLRQTSMDSVGGAQAQSFNMFFTSETTLEEVHNAHMIAWKSGAKSLYYVRNTAPKTDGSAGAVGDDNDCESCGS